MRWLQPKQPNDHVVIDRLKQATRPAVTVGRRALPWPLAVLLLASAYFGTARLGLLLASAHGNVSPVWPATGLAIAALLLWGRRMWPAVTLGAIAANALTPIPLAAAVGIGAGNTLEALLGAWIVVRSVPALHRLGNLAEPAALVGAALVAPVVSALLGVASLGLGGTVPKPALAGLWWTWWVGDALGALVVTPVLMALHETTRESRRWSALAGAKVAAVLALTAFVCGLVFFLPHGTGFLFAIFPVLLVAVAWFGSPGVKLAALLISAISIVAANFGSGPFTGGALHQDLLGLQMFLASVAVAALVLPAFRAAGLFWPR